MEDRNIRRQAAMIVHEALAETAPKDRVQLGVQRAIDVLADERGLDPHGDEGARQMANAVSATLSHREAGGLDFSESSIDVTRMVLAAWSLDRMRDQAMGRNFVDGDDRYVQDVASGYGELYPEVDSTALADHHAYAMTRDAVLAAASVPTEDREGLALWEIAAMGRRSAEALGLAPFPLSIAPTKGERDDLVLEAMNDAAVVREDVGIPISFARNTSFGVSSYSEEVEGRIAAGAARTSFPGELDSVQKGLLASEDWLSKGLGRPLRDYEMRMGDRAVGRAMEQDRTSSLEPVEAARIILLDTSMQMSARRTVDAMEYGMRTSGPKEAYDDVIAASAGMDLHGSSLAPVRETTLPISLGRFSEIPDAEIARSIADGLKDARNPYSSSIDRDLRRSMQSADFERGREMVGIRSGEAAFAAPSITSKGPHDVVAPMDHRVMGGTGRD